MIKGSYEKQVVVFFKIIKTTVVIKIIPYCKQLQMGVIKEGQLKRCNIP